MKKNIVKSFNRQKNLNLKIKKASINEFFYMERFASSSFRKR